MLISDLSVDEILDKYFLDTDKVNMWWQANIDPSKDEVRIIIFKNYVKNLDTNPKEKSAFLAEFILRDNNGQPVSDSSMARGLKRSKKRSNKRSKSRRNKTRRNKSRKNYKKKVN
jgi:hypothetical protein